MKRFLFVVVLAIAGIAVLGFYREWFTFSVDKDKFREDRKSVAESVTNVARKTDDKNAGKSHDAAVPGGQKDRDEFHQTAETRLDAMALNLRELNAKAKTGRTVTKEKMIEAIDDLNKKTETARKELRALRAASPERWPGLKDQFSISLEQLENGYERIFSRFMNESAQLTK